jgi:cytochrome c553
MANYALPATVFAVRKVRQLSQSVLAYPSCHAMNCSTLQYCAKDFMTRTSSVTLRRRFTPATQTRGLSFFLYAIGFVFFGGQSLQVKAQSTIENSIAQRALACAACHGKEGRATQEGYFPRIAGKPAGYLYNQLINFRDGRRQYPLMTYMVAHLSNDYLKEMAGYFSGLHLPYPPPQPPAASAQVLEKGRTLVINGDPSKAIPACIACHGEHLTGVNPSIPSLVGLSRDYLNSQFGAWQNGARRAAVPDCMAEISKKLTPEEIGAVTIWLASQPVPTDMAPSPTISARLPIPCGSFPQ